ncbi:ankyrin repeat domain-containing protein [Candidatus Korarchaeum cryptofilum]|jgi:hypothetical protein|uniref:Ankyrin repeat domain-containing protein n=1 Tax=Candidatus Korarchaeum cryptofilum TaxID=498846 RepID=A0A3R9Q8R9_9CREN|nr:ankyrin repeat domain-containing protein [Candidatus Korarchaeum cryptofilum]RSN68323.1 ankyrin repeat domain-containing protein [Candidatus Korarchaeum cryptofilum]
MRFPYWRYYRGDYLSDNLPEDIPPNVKRDLLNRDLLKAAARGDLEKVRELLDKCADVNARDEFGCTPLRHAATIGNIDIVKFLVERGADIDAKDKFGFTPLHCATSGGHLDIVKFLVERGADVNARDEDGRTSLDLARKYDRLDVVEFLENTARSVARAPITPVMPAVANPAVAVSKKVRKKRPTIRKEKPVKIVDVRCNSLYEGLWGRILISMEGEGTVKVDLEGDVNWIDPGEIIINGEDAVEIPVKPKVYGEVPVRITVKGGEKSTSKIVWLNVTNIQKKSEVASIEKWIEGEIKRVKGFLREIEKS